MHKRKEIKAKIKALILAGKTLAGTRVYTNRFLPIDDQDDDDVQLPAVMIYCGNETSEENNSNEQERTAKVIVDCVVKGPNADELMDRLSEQVEDILSHYLTLGGICETFWQKSGELGGDENIDRMILSWRMTYEAIYITEYPFGDSDPVALKTVDTIIKNNGNQREDVVTLPQ